MKNSKSSNKILISITYCETTPESSEHGDFSDHGFVTEKEELTFSELVEYIEVNGFYQPSSSGDVYTNVWFSNEFYTKCYRTCTERQESIHFHRDNPPNVHKYWKLAFQIALKK